MTSTTSVPRQDAFDDDFHVFEPHKAGLPPLKRYFQAAWQRREFATEMSRTTMHATHSQTFFGQLWLVLNPLLLGFVYFFVIQVLSGGRSKTTLYDLLAGLFVFYYISGAMAAGASSVVTAGKMLLNTNFPRLLLPVASTRTAFRKFLPTLLVLAVLYPFYAHGKGSILTLPLAIPMIAIITVFAFGLACLLATLDVYFRDTTSFLPYFTRIWLYLSPVLYTVEAFEAKFESHPLVLHVMQYGNPLYPMLGAWNDILVDQQVPGWNLWLGSIAWALISLTVGVLFFVSREREFAVRL